MNNFYTTKQPLMIAYEWFESTQDNFDKFIYLKTKTFIWKCERILKKYIDTICFLLFNKCLKENLLPQLLTHTHTDTHTHRHTQTHTHIYIYIYKLATVVEGNSKDTFSIAITLRCRG